MAPMVFFASALLEAAMYFFTPEMASIAITPIITTPTPPTTRPTTRQVLIPFAAVGGCWTGGGCIAMTAR